MSTDSCIYCVEDDTILKKRGYGVRIGSFDDPWHSFQQDSGVEVDAKQFQEYSLVAGKRERSPAVIFC